MQLNLNVTLPRVQSAPDNWLPHFPNPADFRFDYYKLLHNAPLGLARLRDNGLHRVAVVGAGAAGMTAARELLRCGFDVTIYEASDRIGGRLFTRDNPQGSQLSGMEMGAMRMPFFNLPGDQNCLLEYYLLGEAAAEHRALYSQFPNPGSAKGGTGIYLNEGFGPNHSFERPQLIAWPYEGQPDDATIAFLSAKAGRFVTFFTDYIKDIYVEAGERWPQLWEKIVAQYQGMTFDDLVMAPAMNVYAVDDGNFGGFGMTAEEAELLYTIGTGDGSWGAFYSIGALWFLRCTLFGFGGSNLQTIVGYGSPQTLPWYGQPVYDAAGNPLASPTYRGIQSLVEYLFYCKAPQQPASLYESDHARLFTRASVSAIRKLPDARIEVRLADGRADVFEHVFVTATQWATQMSMQFLGFSQEELPQAKITASYTQHNISSCKLFFPLKEQYWQRPDNRIPQVIVTDTFIQDAYALAWQDGNVDPGVILASYTWEDDSLKLLPFDEQALVDKVLGKLRQITLETVQQDITEYIVRDRPVMIQWIMEPGYNGCAKLYRQRDESANAIDLSYNQNYGGRSHLYFVGENYGVEGGWTEPALRSAIDGVLQLLHQVDATFIVQDFDFNRDYPRW
jgi:tryptophan 2-monooxygenase